MSSTTTTIALAGNPNCGKTALFNALTGLYQSTGNWTGVTVDKKWGKFQVGKKTIRVVDLPGTYSLSVSEHDSSLDEKIACEYLLSNEADLIVNILDGSNLERNLYLTLQLLEMNLPVIVAVNMMDIIRKRRIQIHLKKLSQLLHCPTVGLIASRKEGVTMLRETIVKTLKKRYNQSHNLPLPAEINAAIEVLRHLIINETTTPKLPDNINIHWLASRLLEEDPLAGEKVTPSIEASAMEQIKLIEKKLNESPDILIADARYRVAHDIAMHATQFLKTPRQTITQLIDRIVLNRYLSIPIFFLMMYCMFLFAINVGGAFQDFFDISSNTIFVQGLAHILTQWNFPDWLVGIVTNGIGVGINTTITFVPVIGGMFLFLSFLEDSGYMARAAFVMDRFMRALGLPGKSFVPMIVGFGCNVPAVMGTRTLANRRDRILTVMMIPFISCGARLGIFSVFAGAFFAQGGQNIIFILYLVGVLAAIVTGLLLRKTILRGEPAPLVMELPPYHIPRLGALSRQASIRLKSFLTRAGRVILPISLLISALNTVTIGGTLSPGDGSRHHDLLSVTGRVLTPIFSPLGLKKENWPATVGLVTGILAKEVVVGTLNTLYTKTGKQATSSKQPPFYLWKGLQVAILSIPKNLSHLSNALKNPISANEVSHAMSKTAYGLMYHRFDGKLGAFSYLLFVLLYFPCIATTAAMRREAGRGWAWFSVLWSTSGAYAVAVICYQLLSLNRHPMSSSLWIGSLLVILLLVFTSMRYYSN